MCHKYAEAPRHHCRGHAEAHPFAHSEHFHYPGFEHSGPFGVRRPLRFLAWKLQLEEPQIAQLAVVLNDLKTERGQAEVDDRRALAVLAETVESDSFDQAKAREAAALRVQSAEKLQAKVIESLGKIHALLMPEQRARLAYMLRTGTMVM